MEGKKEREGERDRDRDRDRDRERSGYAESAWPKEGVDGAKKNGLGPACVVEDLPMKPSRRSNMSGLEVWMSGWWPAQRNDGRTKK